ncbi:MAG TPA: hypothetical protein VGW31_06380 [Hanamia sp.]|nr:hypothetical protein [Hanamia sp.]
MRRRFRKYMVLFLAVLIAIAAMIGYRAWNKPHENIEDAIAIKTNASLLYNSLANDSLNAKSDFINKVVMVSGKVKQVSENQQKQQVILLQTNIADGSVNCTMEENLKNIKVGDSISLKGICMGYTGGDSDMELPGDVFLIRCYRAT